MSVATMAASPTLPVPPSRDRVVPPFPGNIWHAPLVPVALAVTAGTIADRYLELPIGFTILLAVAGIAAWALASRKQQIWLPLVYLAVSAAALGAAYHHWQRDIYEADDIGKFAKPERQIVCVQGTLDEEPIITWQPSQEELRTIPQRSDPTLAVLRVERLLLRPGDDWNPVSGRAQLVVSDHLVGLHAGDQIEVTGYLVRPSPPANPGEFDHASYLRDQHIQARILVLKTADAVERVAERWPRTLGGWLAAIRGWGQRNLQGVGPMHGGLAQALLLGDGSTMTFEDWEKYMRTGVVHVLAISGQHLVVLAFFLWLLLRLVGIRQRWGALGIAAVLLTYALVVGGRPPVMRSAVAVCVVTGGLLLRRPVLAANSFACAWLIVAVLNPTDLANAGCQLSFLSVAVLYWGVSRWFIKETVSSDRITLDNRALRHRILHWVFGKSDPLEKLIDEARPIWLRALRWLARETLRCYIVTLTIWLALLPLVALRYHTVSFQALFISPPLILLTSIALISGFLLLGCALLCPPLAAFFTFFTAWSLAGCEFLVDLCDRWRWARWYVPDIPEWWVWIFYVGLLAVLMLEPLYRRWRWASAAGGIWLVIGLLAVLIRPVSDELRCTFLAVGHGGCMVIETPDGQTLLYDAGAVTGPDVTRRIIAPYLWSRGIRRIDEVFLSHADLDHFNGIPALLERFRVDRITCTPTFKDKQIPGVPITLQAIADHSVPIRIASAGDHFPYGELEIDVLHPPEEGPEGNENARSMVVLLRHAGHSILLTGDLEKQGLIDVLAKPAPKIDVLMVPHHGSPSANPPGLVHWAKPWYVVSSQEPHGRQIRWTRPFFAKGAQWLLTSRDGAVVIRSSHKELAIETHLNHQRIVMPPRGEIHGD